MLRVHDYTYLLFILINEFIILIIMRMCDLITLTYLPGLINIHKAVLNIVFTTACNGSYF